MTSTRIASAVVAVASLIAIIKFGGYTGIAISGFFISFIALKEFSRMTLEGETYKVARYYLIILGLLAFTISILRNDLLMHSFVLSTLLLFVLFLLLARNPSNSLPDLVGKAGLSLLGIVYAGVCPVYICLLARLSDRLEWFVYTLFIVFVGDTAAYFIGRKFGKTRLFERISPKKSAEGAIAALFASVLAGSLFRLLFLPETDLFLMFILSILTSIVAQLGDLCESMIKRTFQVKDSGAIMPGHGGILDRLDGVLFAAPIVYIYARYLVLP